MEQRLVLTGNLVIADQDLDAIQIETNDVTLDLNGHSIQGPNTGGGSGNGIYALNRYNFTIRNGRVWGFGEYGIRLDSSIVDPSLYRSGHRIEAMHVSNNEWGIRLFGGLLVDSTVDGNRQFGVDARGAALRSVTASRNGIDGITLAHSSAMNCTAFGNGQNGFTLLSSSLRGCAANENGTNGVYLDHSSVTGCRADDNGSSGIGMGSLASVGGNHVFRNSASGNGGTDQIACPNNGTINLCEDNAAF